MNQFNRTLDTAKFVKWVAIITVIVAIVEIPIIYFYFSSKKQLTSTTKKRRPQPLASTLQPLKKIVSESQNLIQTQAITLEDTVALEAVDTLRVLVIEKSTTTINRSLDTGKRSLIILPGHASKTQAEEAPLLKQKTSVVDKKATKTQKAMPVPQQLTEAMMQDIMGQLHAKNEQLQHAIRCVKIRQTSSSNVTNGFKIAEQLKASGFSISGRETISQNVKGVAIGSNSNCLVVTIGSL